MPEIQHCDVCRTAGYLHAGRLAVEGAGADGPPRIARCSRCHRFICEDHGEVLRLSVEGRQVLFGGRRIVCCPFDPGIPLGE